MATAIQSLDSRDPAAPSPADDLIWEFSEDASGRWRWRVTARNGRVIVRSAIHFDSRAECLADAARYGYVQGAWSCTR